MITITTKPLHECQVLIVDDDPLSRTILTSVLGEKVKCHLAQNGDEAIAFCRRERPDLVILDLHMPDKDGITVCRELKAQRRTEAIPVIFVTATLDSALEDQCWQVGAADFVPKPITASTLSHRVTTHLQNKLRMELLESMTLYDQLTGVYNRLYLKYELPVLIKQLSRESKQLSLILVDIDHFKAYNDDYGHLEGDQCLQRVTQCLKACLLRPSDAVVRFGGEEFLVLLPDTDQAGAAKVGERMITAVQNLAIPHGRGVEARVSISAGTACCSSEMLKAEGVSQTLATADNALYAAKAKGRNCLVVEPDTQHHHAGA